MDLALGTSRSPDLNTALSWIANNSENFLGISIHLQMLREMIGAKLTSREKFNGFLFVYLYVDPKGLTKRLSEPNAYGDNRPKESTISILKDFDLCDKIFLQLQDKIIDTTNKKIERVIFEISEMQKESY